jgi:hypothetical protein
LFVSEAMGVNPYGKGSDFYPRSSDLESGNFASKIRQQHTVLDVNRIDWPILSRRGVTSRFRVVSHPISH